MWVDLECDETFSLQVVDDPLHVLAIGAEVTGKPRDRLGPFGSDDGAKNLPAGAGQPESRDQPVALRQKQAVQPEQVEDEVGQGLAGLGSLGCSHMSP